MFQQCEVVVVKLNQLNLDPRFLSYNCVKRNDFIHKILTPLTASKNFSSKKIRVKNGLKRLKTPIQFWESFMFSLRLKSENKHVYVTGTHSKAQNVLFVLCKVSLIE